MVGAPDLPAASTTTHAALLGAPPWTGLLVNKALRSCPLGLCLFEALNAIGWLGAVRGPSIHRCKPACKFKANPVLTELLYSTTLFSFNVS